MCNKLLQFILMLDALIVENCIFVVLNLYQISNIKLIQLVQKSLGIKLLKFINIFKRQYK